MSIHVHEVLMDFLPWALATFPDSTPASCAEHLRREVLELQQDPTDPGEIADCLFLLVDLCQRGGIDLEKACRDKLAILRARQWGKPDSQGVVEHVREPEPTRDTIDLMAALKASLAQRP